MSRVRDRGALSTPSEYVDLGIRAMSHVIKVLVEKGGASNNRELAEEAWRRAFADMGADVDRAMLSNPILLDQSLRWVAFWEGLDQKDRGSFRGGLARAEKAAEELKCLKT